MMQLVFKDSFMSRLDKQLLPTVLISYGLLKD